jgi:hypothetical protein
MACASSFRESTMPRVIPNVKRNTVENIMDFFTYSPPSANYKVSSPASPQNASEWPDSVPTGKDVLKIRTVQRTSTTRSLPVNKIYTAGWTGPRAFGTGLGRPISLPLTFIGTLRNSHRLLVERQYHPKGQAESEEKHSGQHYGPFHFITSFHQVTWIPFRALEKGRNIYFSICIKIPTKIPPLLNTRTI